MKVAFIEARARLNGYHIRFPLMGTLYMGTILKNTGKHRVQVYSELYKPIYDEKAQRIHPAVLDNDVVCLSTLTPTVNRAYAMARAIRRARPQIKILMGGVHASYLPEEAIDYCDVVVKGEGDLIIEDLVENIPAQKAILEGQTVKEMNRLPFPDLSILQNVRLPLSWAPINTARGCPFDCVFCSVTAYQGSKFRFRDVPLVMEELRVLYNQGHRRFFFYDDIFNAKRTRTAELLEAMIASGMKFKWTAQARSEIAREDKILKLLRPAGCNSLCIGFESVNPETLKAYHKMQTVEAEEAAIERLRAADVWVHGMFVLGGDDDTYETIEETVKFCKRLKVDSAQFSILVPLPGTRLYHEWDRENRIFNKDWTMYDGLHLTFRPMKMEPMEFQERALRAWTKFYDLKNRWGLPAYIYARMMYARWKRVNRRFVPVLKALERWPESPLSQAALIGPAIPAH